ncbi:helix-turn-helix domain-containing protein [Conexibacter woesei]|uniref:Transcriptional regulator, XRE family n=1 Tax=Conexibacter woesei (strain DSM 14684 / CCUG 47730 / CIP 108061 / JCM 11494 / NBRC 100937 / ID131577) TaxID=469383 RepID=D3F6M2_CONWI|nr:XRE family transcriptional regulator [Conexibacter woesei]ADB50789.1 transcriptional regulator, XRE family [Conexibacter woesei DSM 14684]
MTAEDDPLARLDGVGARLRALRRRRGHTLSELAERTGISLSTLSRLESGRRRPTLDLLLPLARIYATTLDDLVGMPAPAERRVHPRPFRRDGVTFAPLSRRRDGLSAFTSIHPGQPGRSAIRQVTHPGRDWLYVLRGELRLALGGREHLLRAGEAAEFDTRIPHGLASAGEEPVEVLNLMSAQGRGVRVREIA